MLLLFVHLLSELKHGRAGLPDALDLRLRFPRCPAWSPYDQRDCASCCSAATATVVAARECISDGRASRYSVAQIWDCVGEGGTCAAGGSLVSLLDNLGLSSSESDMALLPEKCGGLAPTASSNLSQCVARYGACQDVPVVRLQSAVFFDAVRFVSSTREDASSAQAMMNEIWRHGPIISVLQLAGVSNIARFRAVRSLEVFAPLDSSNETGFASLRHCIVVTGWGTDAQGTPYWSVLNSYGNAWGAEGAGRIVRGQNVLESQWRAVTPVSRPCTQDECFNASVVVPTTTPAARNDTGLHNNNSSVNHWAILSIALGCGILITLVSMRLFLGAPTSLPSYHQPQWDPNNWWDDASPRHHFLLGGVGVR